MKNREAFKKGKSSLVVNTIDEVKAYVPINKALKVFNISRSTFENYKSIVIHKCNTSYFKWCVKRFSNQLLSTEVEIIKQYMINEDYKSWFKSSIYLKALRDQSLKCSIVLLHSINIVDY